MDILGTREEILQNIVGKHCIKFVGFIEIFRKISGKFYEILLTGAFYQILEKSQWNYGEILIKTLLKI